MSSNVSTTLVPGESAPENQPPEAAAKPVKAAKPAKVKENLEALPTQSDVDPDRIGRAVLTKDGWLCPNPPADEPGARRLR